MKQRFMQMKLIHLALCTGPIAFGAVVFFVLRPSFGAPTPESVQLEWILTGAALALGLGGSAVVPGLLFKKGGAGLALEATILQYQSVKIVQWALIEGPALMALVGHMLGGGEVSLAGAAVLIGLLLFRRPTVEDYAARMGHDPAVVERALKN